MSETDFQAHLTSVEKIAKEAACLRWEKSDGDPELNEAAESINKYKLALKAYEITHGEDECKSFSLVHHKQSTEELEKFLPKIHSKQIFPRPTLQKIAENIQTDVKELGVKVLKVNSPMKFGTKYKFLEPETSLFWIVYFGEAESISLCEFVDALRKHLACTHGFGKLMMDGSNVTDDIEKTFLGTLKTVMCKEFKGDDHTMKKDEYKLLMARFGPFKHLLRKMCTLTVYHEDGKAAKWFLPSKSHDTRHMSKNDIQYYVRYSSQFGYLVYQSPAKKLLIYNSYDGYNFEDTQPQVDIPELLKQEVGQDEFQKSSQFANVILKGYKTYQEGACGASAYGELQDGASRPDCGGNMYHQEEKKKNSNYDKLQPKKNIHYTFQMLKHSENERFFPRAFMILPSSSLELEERKTFIDKASRSFPKDEQSKWTVHILCEGLNGQCHKIQDHGFEITVPNETFSQCIPYIRASLLCVSTAEGIVELTDELPCCGCETLSDLGKGYKKIEELDNSYALNDDDLMDNGINKTKMLQLFDGNPDISEELIEQGECSGLTYCFSRSKKNAMWLCEKCRSDESIDQDNIKSGSMEEDMSIKIERTEDFECKEEKVDSNEELEMSESHEVPPKEPKIVLGPVVEKPAMEEKPLYPGAEGAKKVYVRVLRASNLINADKMKTKFNSGNVSDPFCVVIPYFGLETDKKEEWEAQKSRKTQVQPNNLDPDWDEEFEWELPSENGMRIRGIEYKLYDKDRFGKDKLGGHFLELPYENKWQFEEEVELVLEKMKGQSEEKGGYGKVVTSVLFE